MDHLIIDRFEETYAVCERDDGTMQDILRSLLPEQSKEGSCLTYDGEHYAIDYEESTDRRERIARKVNDLFRD
ncbi:MAG: DUF3006 domain-containing protein [Eggerthellaceae bacterium]|jgi:hypothetical protein|nr:DUF3006 domain-containing protein [Eggerthellaceae bacterium]MCH4221692.1 DUF3006 domain-containing protein [Eggerthellaceae bacterium]